MLRKFLVFCTSAISCPQLEEGGKRDAFLLLRGIASSQLLLAINCELLVNILEGLMRT